MLPTSSRDFVTFDLSMSTTEVKFAVIIFVSAGPASTELITSSPLENGDLYNLSMFVRLLRLPSSLWSREWDRLCECVEDLEEELLELCRRPFRLRL